MSVFRMLLMKLKKKLEALYIKFIKGNSIQPTQVELYKSSLWQDGYVDFQGSYPTTSTDFPNSKYFVVKMKAGQQIKMTVTSSSANIGRVRYINPATNEVIQTVVSGDNNGWLTSTNTENGGFRNTIFYATQDVDLGFVNATGITNEIVSLLWEGASPTPQTPISIESVGDAYPVYQKISDYEQNWSILSGGTLQPNKISWSGNVAVNNIIASNRYNYTVPIIENHKYLFRIRAKFNYYTRVIQVNVGAWKLLEVQGDGNYNRYALFTTATATKNIGNQEIRISQAVEAKENVYFEGNNLEMFDLTEMYGVGNEPTTIEQFEADYPDKYYPYFEGNKYQIPIEISSKNLFDKSKGTLGYLTGAGRFTGEYDASNLCSDFIEILEGETYTFSAGGYDVNKSVSWDGRTVPRTDWIGYAFYDENKVVIGSRLSVNGSQATFTSPAGAKYLRIGARHIAQESSWIMLEQGTEATPYTPYFEPTYPIVYVNDTIKKVDVHADIVDFDKNKVIKNVKDLKFTGYEDWFVSSSGGKHYYSIPKSSLGTDLPHSSDDIMCSHFKVFSGDISDLPIGQVCVGNNNINFNFDGVNDDIASFETWLSQNDVHLLYPLITPTEEVLGHDKIIVPDGAIVKILTKVQPSEFAIGSETIVPEPEVKEDGTLDFTTDTNVQDDGIVDFGYEPYVNDDGILEF